MQTLNDQQLLMVSGGETFYGSANINLPLLYIAVMVDFFENKDIDDFELNDFINAFTQAGLDPNLITFDLEISYSDTVHKLI